jgi:hypothetical protein
MSNHDDIDDLSPEELALAQALAAKVDDLVAGKAMPRIGDAQEQELLRTSAMIRAAHHEVSLDATRQSALIEEAMRSALPGTHKEDDFHAVHSLDAARAKRRRNWSIAATALVAACAIALLWFRTANPQQLGGEESQPLASLQELPQNERSRPSDALIGQIAPEQSGMSSARLDQIYGDRMAGYRALQFRRMAGKQ